MDTSYAKGPQFTCILSPGLPIFLVGIDSELHCEPAVNAALTQTHVL